MNICYRRVSTGLQETERQFDNSNIVFDREYEDKLSGKDTNRPQLQACLSSLVKGETLHIWEVSRLGRNLDDLRNIVFSLINKGVNVKFHKEGLEFSGDETDGMKFAVSKMMLNMLGSASEFERSMIIERIKDGIATAKRKGVKFGRANKNYTVSESVTSNEKRVSVSCHKATITQADKLRTLLMLSDSKQTLSSLCRGMERLKVLTVKGRDKWNAQQIKNLINQHSIDTSMIKGVVW